MAPPLTIWPNPSWLAIGGGFVILNGIGFDSDDGSIREYESPYPGSNIFSLASGGAIYVRDPHRHLVDEHLNGGEFAKTTDDDWKLIQPYLEENERLFDITIDRLLTVDDRKRAPKEVYRKIRPKKAAASARDDDGLGEWADWSQDGPGSLRRDDHSDGQDKAAPSLRGGGRDDLGPVT
jgi:hypothetical protein